METDLKVVGLGQFLDNSLQHLREREVGVRLGVRSNSYKVEQLRSYTGIGRAGDIDIPPESVIKARLGSTPKHDRGEI
jgi:hypothetical protein